MRLQSLALLFLLLLPGMAHAQPDPVRPVQVIIDAIPEVADLTVAEASQDLTPDDALLLLDVMQAYVANFTRTTTWPEGSSADDPEVRAAFAKAVQATDIIARVPDHLAAVEEARAACLAAQEGAPATPQDVRDWIDAWFAGILRVQSAAGTLDRLLDGSTLPLDPTPLHNASAILLDWRDSNADAAFTCIVEVAQELGVDVPDDVILVQVTPDRAYPTQQVTVYGAVFGGTGHVTIDVGGVGRYGAPVIDGGFEHNLTLPLRTSFGEHLIAATSGPAEDSTILTVVRAPSTITVRAPTAIDVGDLATVDIQVDSPIPNAVEGRVELSGPTDRALRLDNGAASTNLTGLPAGEHRLRVHYPGSFYVAPSNATVTITVRAEAAVPVGAGSGTGGSGAFTFPAIPGSDKGFLGLGPGAWAWLVPLLVVLAAAAAVFLRRTRWTRLIPSPRQRFRLIPEISLAGQGVVRLFARVHATLVRLGFIRPGTTPRESLAFFQARSVDAEATVTAFERTRYGGRPEDPDQDADTASWAQKVWSMFRRDA